MSTNITLLPQFQYMDKFRLDSLGVSPVPNHAVKQALGFSDVQTFTSNLLNAVAQVASTSIGDDCGEGTSNPEWANSPYASNMSSPGSYFGPYLSVLTPWITGIERARTGIPTI